MCNRQKPRCLAHGRDIERSDPTGLYYYNARYYDASIGRFASPDPALTAARYAYVVNNPLRYTDPSGLIHRAGELVEIAWEQHTITERMPTIINADFSEFMRLSGRLSDLGRLVSDIRWEDDQQARYGGELVEEMAHARIGGLDDDVVLVTHQRAAIGVNVEGGGVRIHVETAETLRDAFVHGRGNPCGNPGAGACVPDNSTIIARPPAGELGIGPLVHEAGHLVDRPSNWFADVAWSVRYRLDQRFKYEAEARAEQWYATYGTYGPPQGSPRAFWVLRR